MKPPAQIVKDNPNASILAVTGAAITIASVLLDDLAGYDPSSPAFWPAVVTVVGAAVLAFGKRRT